MTRARPRTRSFARPTAWALPSSSSSSGRRRTGARCSCSRRSSSSAVPGRGSRWPRSRRWSRGPPRTRKRSRRESPSSGSRSNRAPCDRRLSRTALIGATGERKGPARPLITLEQLRMLSSLRAADRLEPRSDIPPAAVAAATVAASFAPQDLGAHGRALAPGAARQCGRRRRWYLGAREGDRSSPRPSAKPLLTPRIGSVRSGT